MTSEEHPGQFRTFDTLERHLTDKIEGIESNLSGKINSVEASLVERIQGVERFFTAENKSAKDAVSIAMTAAEKASQKAEIAADERTRSIAVRLDKMEQTLSTSSGVSQGVGASAAILFQIISMSGIHRRAAVAGRRWPIGTAPSATGSPAKVRATVRPTTAERQWQGFGPVVSVKLGPAASARRAFCFSRPAHLAPDRYRTINKKARRSGPFL